MKTDGRDHFVYRLYDEFDELLYVGVTTNFKQRMAAHGGFPWFKYVHHHTLEEVGTDQRAAMDREAEVIRTEEPLKNVQHSTLPDWILWVYDQRKRGPWEPITKQVAA